MRKLTHYQVHDRETALRRLSGCATSRVTDDRNAKVEEHRHDWPVLSLYVTGGYTNMTVLGERQVSSPAAILYRAGEAHANLVGSHGFEQIEIEFDPDWLNLTFPLPSDPVRFWIGGPVAASARALAAIWRKPAAPDAELARATRNFLCSAVHAPDVRRPAWLDRAVHRLASDAPPITSELARELGMDPAWFSEAYRKAVGEGVRETVMRRRVELSACLLRETDTPPAEIAAGTGFCDQSHMVRAFRKWLGRTPSQVRGEGTGPQGLRKGSRDQSFS